MINSPLGEPSRETPENAFDYVGCFGVTGGRVVEELQNRLRFPLGQGPAEIRGHLVTGELNQLPLSYRGEDRSDLSALAQPLRPSEDAGDVVVTHECSDSDRSNVSFMHRRAAKMRLSSEWRGCLCIKLPK